MSLAELEKRVKALERTVEALRKQKGASRRWWVDDAGRFANDPAFDEIVRLGQAYRRASRQRRRKKSG